MPEAKYWKIAAGVGAQFFEACQRNNYISLGWKNILPDDFASFTTEDEYKKWRRTLRERYCAKHFEKPYSELNQEERNHVKNNFYLDGNSNVWLFYKEISIGDYFIVNEGFSRVIAAGIITSDATHVKDESTEQPHRRSVQWLNFNPRNIERQGDWQPTIRPIAKSFFEGLTNEDNHPNVFHDNNINEPDFCMTNNQILFGAPGTGKTHALTSLALSILAPNHGDDASYVTHAQSIINGEDLTEVSNEDYQTWHSKLQEFIHAGRVEFTTFHQNYAYEDFVEGLKAELDEESGTVHYNIEPGILKRIAYRALYSWLTGDETDFELDNDQIEMVKYYLSGEKAHGNKPDDPIPNYVLIIDEINRGNVARIFGELITLVEGSKRACREITPASQPVFATLPYTKKRFILPPNLHIIGTMNTADRSLIGLDAALRRRFDFIELPPRPELLSTDVDGINLQNFLSALNQRIEEKDTRDHCIGHAYFMVAKSSTDIKEVMRRKVIPQLQEYFHDRPTELKKLLTVGERSFVNDKGVIDSVALGERDMYAGFASQ
jgi:hypothetical protein